MFATWKKGAERMRMHERGGGTFIHEPHSGSNLASNARSATPSQEKKGASGLAKFFINKSWKKRSGIKGGYENICGKSIL